MVGSPRRPPVFDPQQYASDWVESPQVPLLPVEIELHDKPPLTAVGAFRAWVVPSPSWPWAFAPQQ